MDRAAANRQFLKLGLISPETSDRTLGASFLGNVGYKLPQNLTLYPSKFNISNSSFLIRALGTRILVSLGKGNGGKGFRLLWIDAMVAPLLTDLKNGKCNLRLEFVDITSKEATLSKWSNDVLQATRSTKPFQVTADAPEIYKQGILGFCLCFHNHRPIQMNNKKHIIGPVSKFRDILQICP
ncbi:hypothetical protein Tco_0059263 [Tanacetum coccineum]